MIGLLFSPIGRYALIGIIVIMVLAGGYVKIQSDAVNSIKAQANSDALKRTQNAVTAGDAVDVSPDRLLQDDGHRRD